jgi:hypothetical protein
MIKPTVIVHAGEAKDDIGRIRDNLPRLGDKLCWVVAQKYSKHMRQAAQALFDIPTGETEKMIRPVKLADGYYAVMGTEQAWAINNGRGPSRGGSPMPTDDPKFVAWAHAVGKDPIQLARSIARFGTRGRPFIQYGIMNAKEDTHRSVTEHADYFIISKGQTLE